MGDRTRTRRVGIVRIIDRPLDIGSFIKLIKDASVLERIEKCIHLIVFDFIRDGTDPARHQKVCEFPHHEHFLPLIDVCPGFVFKTHSVFLRVQGVGQPVLASELAGRQGQMELLQAVLADSRGFAELVDHYIYFYTSELPGWYEGLENQEQAYAAARKALQRLQVFAERFLGYKLASTGSGLHEICRQLERLLEQKALDSAGLAELASPDRLEALIQDDLILIESYLGEDLQRS